jgi:Na+/proline symporter
MLISVLWGVLAGIKTVIWTDFLLFILFALGAGFALIFMLLGLERTLPETLIWLDHQAKLVLFDFDTDPEKRYTIWAGIIGAIGLSIAQGSTQGTWQRVKACRSVGDAQKAFNFAALFYVMHLVILGVGLALVAFYGEKGLPDELARELQSSPDRIFPHFIATELPIGISGIFIAAIFAAAISTLDSALAESSDLTINHIYVKWRSDKSEAHYLQASKVFMLFWGLIFFALALVFDSYSAQGLLDLTFKLPNYVYGAIFGSIILARLGIGTFPTVILGFMVACLLVTWMASAGVAFFYWCPVSGLSMVALVWALNPKQPEWQGVV